MGLHVYAGSEGRLLNLDGRCSRPALAHMGGDQLGIDARRVNQGKAGDERD